MSRDRHLALLALVLFVFLQLDNLLLLHDTGQLCIPLLNVPQTPLVDLTPSLSHTYTPTLEHRKMIMIVKPQVEKVYSKSLKRDMRANFDRSEKFICKTCLECENIFKF